MFFLRFFLYPDYFLLVTKTAKDLLFKLMVALSPSPNILNSSQPLARPNLFKLLFSPLSRLIILLWILSGAAAIPFAVFSKVNYTR